MRRVHSTIAITLTACLLLSACATYTPAARIAEIVRALGVGA